MVPGHDMYQQKGDSNSYYLKNTRWGILIMHNSESALRNAKLMLHNDKCKASMVVIYCINII